MSVPPLNVLGLNVEPPPLLSVIVTSAFPVHVIETVPVVSVGVLANTSYKPKLREVAEIEQ